MLKNSKFLFEFELGNSALFKNNIMVENKFSWCVTHFCDDFTIEHYIWYKEYRDQLRKFLADEFACLTGEDILRITNEDLEITNLLHERISILY